jgi:hypothetical protein
MLPFFVLLHTIMLIMFGTTTLPAASGARHRKWHNEAQCKG